MQASVAPVQDAPPEYDPAGVFAPLLSPMRFSVSCCLTDPLSVAVAAADVAADTPYTSQQLSRTVVIDFDMDVVDDEVFVPLESGTPDCSAPVYEEDVARHVVDVSNETTTLFAPLAGLMR